MSYSSNQPPGGSRVLPVPPAPTGPLHSGNTPSPSPTTLPKRLSVASLSGIQGLNLTAAPASTASYSSANKPTVPRGSLPSNGPSKAVADMAAQIARNNNNAPGRVSVSSTSGLAGSPPPVMRNGAASPSLGPSAGPLVDRSSNERSSVIDRALAVNRGSSPAIDRSPLLDRAGPFDRDRAPSIADRGSLSSNNPPQSTTPSFLHRNSISGVGAPSVSTSSSAASPFTSPSDPNKPSVFRRSVVPPPINSGPNSTSSAAPTPTHQGSAHNGPSSGREPPSSLRLSTHRESPPPSPSPVRSPPPFVIPSANPRPAALDLTSPPSTISRPPVSSISAAAAAAAHAHYRAGLAQTGSSAAGGSSGTGGNSGAPAPTPVHVSTSSFDRSSTAGGGSYGNDRASSAGFERGSVAAGGYNDRASLAGGYNDRASLAGGYNDRASMAGGGYNDRASVAGGQSFDRASNIGGGGGYDRASNFGGNFTSPTPSAAAGSAGFPFTPHGSSSGGGFGSSRLAPPDLASNAGGPPSRPTAPRRSVFRPPTVAMPFSGTLDHKFSVVHDQVDAGLYTLKRLGGMARRLSAIVADFTKELREEAQHEQSHAQDKILQSDKAMSFTAAYDAVLQSHFIVARQFETFAQALDQNVASPVLQAHRDLDATRKGIVSEEQRATSELIKLKEQVTRQRIKCYASWKLLVEADGELQRAFSALYGSSSSGPLSGAASGPERLGVPVIFSQGGAPSPNSAPQPLQMDDKTRKNLEKKLFAAEKKRAAAAQQTQKDFSKCEDLVLVTARTQSEYTSTVIPALMQRLEDVERQRLRIARDASERYASSFSLAVNLATPAQQLSVTVGNLDDAGDIARYTAAMLAAHGRPPTAAPVEALLPCPASDLDSDAWRKQLGFDVDAVMPKDPSSKPGFTDLFFGKSSKDAASLVYSGAVTEGLPSGPSASGFSVLGPQGSVSPSSSMPSVVLTRPLVAPPVYRCVNGFTGGQHHSYYHAAGCPRAPKPGAPPLDLGSSQALDVPCSCNAPAALMEASPAPVSSSSAAAVAAANAGSIVLDLVIPHGAYVFVTDTRPAPASPSSGGEMTAVTSSPFFGAGSRDSASMGSIGSDLSPRSFFTNSGGGGGAAGGGGGGGPRRCTIHSQSGSGSGGSQSVSGSQSRPCASTPSAGPPDDDDGEEDSFNSTTGFLNGSSHAVSTNQRPQGGLLVSVAAGQGAPPALPSRPTTAAVAALRERRGGGGDDPATRARLILAAATVGARLRDAQASSRSSSNGCGREDSVGSRDGCSCSPGNHSGSSRSSGEVARYPCGERVWCGELITAPLSPTSVGQQFAQAASAMGNNSEVIALAAKSAAARSPYGVGAFPAALLERVVFDDNVPLAYLLHVPEARALFIDHLKREYSVENYDFWSKVQAFRLRPWRAAAASSTQVSVQKAMLEAAEDICATYVRNDAPHQVNLKGEIQSEVLSAVAAAKAGKALLSAAVFVSAEEEIYRLLSQDSLSRFKKTPVFAQLLQAARMSQQQQRDH